jgi:putative endonuclease
MRRKEYYVYILASRPGGVIYVGVTNDLIRRVYEHKNGLVPGFTKRYGTDQLVYFEVFDSIYNAIQREKNIKHWPRAWKTRLIAQQNPSWRDLYEEIVWPSNRVAGTSPAMTAEWMARSAAHSAAPYLHSTFLIS